MVIGGYYEQKSRKISFRIFPNTTPINEKIRITHKGDNLKNTRVIKADMKIK